jgi:cell division protein FtsW (lipid II flippase)
VTSFMFGVNLFMSSHTKSLNSKLPYAEHYKSYGVVAILFFIIFIVLLLKPIYKRYQPTFKTWLLMSGMILLLIVDKLIFK